MSTAHPIRNVTAGIFALAAFMGVGRFAYTLIVPSMMSELGFSAADAGFIASSNLSGYLVGAVLAASRIFTGRERAVLMFALVSTVVLTASMPLADSIPVFATNRFLGGVASALGLIFITSLVAARLTEARRGDMLIYQFSGVGLGIVLSSVICAAVIAAGGGWRAMYAACGALTLVSLVATTTLLQKGPPLRARGDHEPPLPRSRPLRNMTIAYGLFGFGYIITTTFLVAIVRDQGNPPSVEALVWLVTGLAVLPSTYLWGRVADRAGITVAYAVGCVVEAIGVMASVTLPGIGGPLIGAVLLGSTFVATTALGIQYARQLAPESPRKALSSMTTVLSVTQILGPIAAGLLASQTGSYLIASILAAVILVASGLCVIRDR